VTATPPTSERPDPGLPTRIGKYRIMRRLGEGTTSEVFLGHDEFNDRSVAVKRVRSSVLRDTVDGHVFSRFFASEAALAGRLHHPNVVDIFDAVPDPAEPYVVMEYVPGTTLRAYCQPGHLLPLEQIVEIGFKCAMALSYCFKQGLIHRDVKPANIFAVESQGVVTDVKIGDFGSALNLTSDATQVHRVGSLAYMSPEQLDGSELDSRADIYSLGAVLYHLVAGQPPFDGVSQATLMHQICHAHPPSLVGLRTGVSPALDQVVQRCLAKQARDRYASWDELGEALSRLITMHDVPRGALQGVLDSERFTLLRTLDFFTNFGDVALWEVVHRARWQRFQVGHALYNRGEEGRTFHIIASGAVEVYRDGQRAAQLGSGTSVGEMAYLAPSPELRQHSADVVVTEAATTISFTPDTLARLSPNARHLFDEAFIRVLVRRLHAAHEALAHPRRIL
jgi:serine/threonine protein kinase